MFFQKLSQGKKPSSDGNTGKSSSATSTFPATGNIRITKVKVAATSPLRPASSLDRSKNKSVKDHTERQVKSSPARKRKRNPDLGQFNKVTLSTSETDYDDSSWETEFNKRVSSSTPPVNRLDKRDLYGGEALNVSIIESISLMKFAEYQPC